MLEVESMVLAEGIICLKKYTEDYVSSWKFFLNHYLEKVGGKLILPCQFDTRKLPSLCQFFVKLSRCLVIPHNKRSRLCNILPKTHEAAWRVSTTTLLRSILGT